MEWLALLGETPVARVLARSPILYLFVNGAHILSIGALFGSILVLDLRLMGFLARLPLGPVAGTLWKISAAGLACAIFTGLLLFSVRPMEYLANPAFLTKLVLVALGIANAGFVHASRGWGRVLAGEPVPPLLRFTALLSLSVWVSAVIAGRWIGFL
ncbi:DUF2214 domain-containing protein [Pseudomonas sp. R2.Fl]|nr:DUF2214 domain-containing protein [Pseudomonas sp. R2.Fl]